MELWLSVVVGALLVVLWKYWEQWWYWENKGVADVKPLPLFGSFLDVAFKRNNIAVVVEKIYNNHPGKRYIGYYEFTKPVLMIKDPELIKQICIKDFDVFPEHNPFVLEELDPLWSNTLFAVGAKKWKDLRTALSPAFTASKMRLMFGLMDDVAKDHTSYYRANQDIELKDLFSRFTNDVIASAAFGVRCDSLRERENRFYMAGKKASNFSGVQILKIFGMKNVPWVIKMLKLRLFDQKMVDFFSQVISYNIKQREEGGIYRPDMIQLLLTARKTGLSYDDDAKNVAETGFGVAKSVEPAKAWRATKRDFTDEDIMSQALVFFLGGFETTSNLVCHVVYELALNPEVQEKLTKEIDETIGTTDTELTYEKIAEMKYLDMVVSEALRKWPPAIVTDRRCVKRYVVPAQREGETDLILEKGSVVLLPMWAMHRDPKYFPNPEKFDPERFNEVNRKNVDQGCYFPFGVGPRSCIGSRFAILETKILVTRLLQKFQFAPTKRTQMPLKLTKKALLLQPDDGFWLALMTRT
nr:cytochrome P450 monooxygenase CYP9EL1 [Lasioderma serricorne]